MDAHFSTQGTWVGLSLGWVTVRWRTHILSAAEHRLNHAEAWTEQCLHTLRARPGPRVHPLDLSDDRLAAVLEAVSDHEHWPAFEGALHHALLHVDELRPKRVRRDSTTAHGPGSVTEDAQLQVGHRTDPRPDVPPVTVMLWALDPLGLPVAG